MKPKKIITIAITTSVVISFFLMLVLIRTCLSFSTWQSLTRLICSPNIISNQSLYKKLSPTNMITTSNIPESPEHSLAKGFGAKNLTDGFPQTMAYPASQQIDYTIDLIDTYQVKQINIIWGDAGTSDIYLNRWTLQAQVAGDEWFELAQGGFPGDRETVVKKVFMANKLRLKAESEKNWFGINEVEVIARLP